MRFAMSHHCRAHQQSRHGKLAAQTFSFTQYHNYLLSILLFFYTYKRPCSLSISVCSTLEVLTLMNWNINLLFVYLLNFSLL